MSLRRLHDVLYTPTIDRRAAISIGLGALLVALAIISWDRGLRWIAAIDAVAAAFNIFCAVVRILHLRRSP